MAGVSELNESKLSDLPVGNVETLLERLPPYFTMSVASKRNSGKTVLVTQIVKALLKANKVDMVLVLSNSAGLNKDFGFLPPGLVMKFNETVLNQLWDRQRKVAKKKA